MVFWRVERLDGQCRDTEPSTPTAKRLKGADPSRVVGVVEGDLYRGELSRLCPLNNGLAEGVIQPIKVRLARAPGQFVEAERDIARARPSWARPQLERGDIPKFRIRTQFMLRQAHQQMLKAGKIDLRVIIADLQLLANLVIEIFEQLLPSLAHRLVDLEAQFELQLVEC